MSDRTLTRIGFVIGTYVAPIAGAVVGAMFSPLIGFLASSWLRVQGALMMSAYHDNTPMLEGPEGSPFTPIAGRDVSQPANYGVPIQQVWGVARVQCSLLHVANAVKLNDAVTVWHEFSKGDVAGAVTLAKMDTNVATFAVLIGGPITAVHRIWFNGSVVYDRRIFGDARVQYRTTSANFTVYFGTDDQMPDPDLGIDVAYRGRSYIVFKNVSLVEFNNRVPEVVVEVSGADIGFQYAGTDEYDNEVIAHTEAIRIVENVDKTGYRVQSSQYNIGYDYATGNIEILDGFGNPVDVNSLTEQNPWDVFSLPSRAVTDPDGTLYQVRHDSKTVLSFPKSIWRYFDNSLGADSNRYWLPGPNEIPGRFFGNNLTTGNEPGLQEGEPVDFNSLFEQVDSWFFKDQLTHGDSDKLRDKVRAFSLSNDQIVAFKNNNTIPKDAKTPFFPDKQKLNLWAIGDEVPLSFPIYWLLKNCGFSDDEIDVDEIATIKARAILFNTAKPAGVILAHICNAYQLTVCESEGRIKVRPANQPAWNKNYDNCLINEAGFIVNSLHDVPGRDGYFPSSCGTSEGQFTMARAAGEAYLATNDLEWLDFATRLINAAADRLYLFPPNSGKLFVPHWLFNTKRPVKMDSGVLYANIAHDGSLTVKIPFDPAFRGDKTKEVHRVGTGWGAYLWKNVYADLVYVGYAPTLNIAFGSGSGRWWYWPRVYQQTVCDAWAYDQDGNPIACVQSHNEYAWGTTYSESDSWSYSFSYTFVTYSRMGKIVRAADAMPLDPSTIIDYQMDYEILGFDANTGTVSFALKPGEYPSDTSRVFVSYVRSEVGEYLNVNQWMEAWPFWRKTTEGEIAGAGDSLYWAYDAYELMYAITGDKKYLDCANATKQTTIDVHAVDDGRLWWFEFPGTREVFVDNSIFFNTDRSSTSLNNVTREIETGYVVIDVKDGAGEVQLGRGFLDNNVSPTDSIQYDIELLYKNTTIQEFQYDPQKGVQKTGIAIWFDTSMTFDPAKRFICDLGARLQNGLFSGAIPVSEFKTLLNGASPLTQYSGDPIYAFGISVFQDGLEVKLRLKSVRPIPEIPVPYSPGAPVFTVNTFLGNKIPWAGVPGIGYSYPHFWQKIGRTIEFGNLKQFLLDAAAEYTNRTGETGWMVPAYYWPRFDNLDYGTPGTWGWDWVDPNSQWGGYFYRNLASMAETTDAQLNNLAFQRINRVNTDWPGWPQFIPTDVKGETLPRWQPNTRYEWRGYNGNSDIIAPTVKNGFVYKPVQNGVSGTVEPAWPTVIGSQVADGGVIWECTGYHYGVGAYGNYHEPHFAALMLRAVMYLDLNNALTPTERSIALNLGQKCFNYLDSLYRGTPGDPMEGSFAEPNNNWWGFWHGEIVITLSLIKRNNWAPASWLDMSKIDTWLAGSLEFWKRWDRKRYG